MDYYLDNCPRSAHALRNRISSSGNAGRDLSIKTDAVIIKVDIDNNDVEKYRRLVGILDLESKANVARRVSSREADANQYRYDALGRRVIRQEGTTKTALIWWGDSECAEHKHQAGQTVIQNDIMAHPSRLNSVIARAVDGSKFKLEWYHKNYLDHVYAVSDDSGDILEHYRYTAFGEVQIYNASGNQVSTTQIDNHILWNTRRRDELTGYYMYKYRHYSAELGRWLARDPIGERGGVNLYAFVGNDPIGRWDLLGELPVPANAGVTAENIEAYKACQEAQKKTTNDRNKKIDKEYCGLICCKDGKKERTKPIPGFKRKVDDKGTTTDSCNPFAKGNCAKIKGAGWKTVGTYHSHTYGNRFSSGDFNAAKIRKIRARRDIPNYLGAPNGKCYKLLVDPNKPKTDDYGNTNNMPADTGQVFEIFPDGSQKPVSPFPYEKN